MSKTYYVLSNLNHDQVDYPKGEMITLNDEQAKPLLQGKIISKVRPAQDADFELDSEDKQSEDQEQSNIDDAKVGGDSSDEDTGERVIDKAGQVSSGTRTAATDVTPGSKNENAKPESNTDADKENDEDKEDENKTSEKPEAPAPDISKGL